MAEPQLRAGRLLVATPLLDDPNFERTVVMLIDHDDEGSVGVVLNRPGMVPVKEVLPAFELLAASPGVVFGGGPVMPEGILCVAQADHDTPEFLHLMGGIGVLGLGSEIPPHGVSQVRLFAGYSGWGAHQLDAEFDAGAWFVLDARPSDAFTTRPDELWARVLRRAGGRLAMFATLPEDPRQN